ncbi:MAG: hypothetical protein HYV09_14790 [Deltaproteobacteria bacterium]|nr:hypothetical protein [Deltaproteobacteria bacterium]
MRALRRIATPASVAVVIGGCTYPFDDYLPQKTDGGLATNARRDTAPDPAAPPDGGDEGAGSEDETSAPRDSGVFDTAADASDPADAALASSADTSAPADTFGDTFVAEDTFVPKDTAAEPKDACTCVKIAGGKCKEWSPPGCGD